MRLRSPSPGARRNPRRVVYAHHLVEEFLAVNRVRVRMVAAEIGQRHEIADRAGGAPRRFSGISLA